MKKLSALSKALTSLGFKKESGDVDSLIKTAFINNAKIHVDVGHLEVTSILKGTLPSGREAEFGKCYINRISRKNAVLASSPKTSAWEFHRNIYGAEYEGLGYMNELLVAAIYQVQNNGGVVFNGIGSEIYGSGVSDLGKSHTLSKLGKSLVKQPVIVFYVKNKNLYFIFEQSEQNLAKKIFHENYGVLLEDYLLHELFSTPYMDIYFSDISPDFEFSEYNNNRIVSGFKITATSSKTSIPVSISLETDESSVKQTKEEREFDHEKLDSLRFDLQTLKDEFNNILNLIFSGANLNVYNKSRLLNKILNHNSAEDVSWEKMNELLNSFIQNLKSTDPNVSEYKFNEELYNSSKFKLEDNWSKIVQVERQISQLFDEWHEPQAEFDKRKREVGIMRGMYTRE